MQQERRSIAGTTLITASSDFFFFFPPPPSSGTPPPPPIDYLLSDVEGWGARYSSAARVAGIFILSLFATMRFSTATEDSLISSLMCCERPWSTEKATSEIGR